MRYHDPERGRETLPQRGRQQPLPLLDVLVPISFSTRKCRWEMPPHRWVARPPQIRQEGRLDLYIAFLILRDARPVSSQGLCWKLAFVASHHLLSGLNAVTVYASVVEKSNFCTLFLGCCHLKTVDGRHRYDRYHKSCSVICSWFIIMTESSSSFRMSLTSSSSSASLPPPCQGDLWNWNHCGTRSQARKGVCFLVEWSEKFMIQYPTFPYLRERNVTRFWTWSLRLHK